MNLFHEAVSFSSELNVDMDSNPDMLLTGFIFSDKSFKHPSLSLHTYKIRTIIAALKVMMSTEESTGHGAYYRMSARVAITKYHRLRGLNDRN